MSTHKQFFRYLLRTLALVKLKRVQGVTVGLIEADGAESSMAFLAPGTERLLLLRRQIEMLTTEEKVTH